MDTPVVETTEQDTEGRELRSLIHGSDVSGIMDAVLHGRKTEGRTAELQSHYNLGFNMVPIELLETRSMEDELETRAVTPGAADVGQNQSNIVPGVFPQSVAAFLGISTPTVGGAKPSFRF